MPRMAFYIDYSTRIYRVYLKYVSAEDIHVYSIDEVFMDVAPDKVRETMSANSRGVSLDSPLQDDEDGTLLDVTPDNKLEATDNSLNNESLRIELDALLNSLLKEREALIIKQTFGIDCPEKSQEEVSQELGLTRERVRQIRERALLKIRKSPNAKLLLAYL